MKWKPLGKVYWTERWAQCPTPLVMDDRIVVYFAERDEQGKSFIRYIDLCLDDPTKLLNDIPSQCVLGNGPLGAFDQDGVIPAFAEFRRGDIDLYYSGWCQLANGCYQNAMGLARSLDGGKTFARVHEGPIMDRAQDHPYLAVTPCIAGNSMWYIDGLRWEMIDGRPEPIYTIAHAEWDGSTENWWRDQEALFPIRHHLECFSRPWVIQTDMGYEMLFSYRLAVDYRDGVNAYRIGCALSKDGLEWERVEDPEIQRTPGFDDTMQAYAATFDMRGKRYLLWNGNGFGQSGFALGVQE